MDDKNQEIIQNAYMKFFESMPDGLHAQLVKTYLDGSGPSGVTFLILAESPKALSEGRKVLDLGSKVIRKENLHQQIADFIEPYTENNNEPVLQA